MITIDYARALYDDSDPVHDFDHVLRVLALAQRIGRAEGADLLIVETAVLLHDIQRAHEDQQAHVQNTETADHALVAADLDHQLEPALYVAGAGLVVAGALVWRRDPAAE